MSFGLSSEGSWSSSGSDTSTRRSDHDGDDELLNAVQEIQSPPRPSKIDYESYTALVRIIDKGDNLIAKKILATRASELEPNSESSTTTRWPLQAGQLGEFNEVEYLGDSILAFASSYIRQNRLILPRQESFSSRTDLESMDLDELDERIPAFLPNMMDQIDTLLDGLSAMRPEGSSRKRKQMRPMGWESVVSAGLLSEIDPSVLSKTNGKMRELLDVDSDDVVEHRLSILRKLTQNEPELEPLSELYPSVKPKKDGVQRSHLSRKQLEERATKREARLAKSQAKAEKRRAIVAQQTDTRPTKRRRKDESVVM